MVLIFKQLYQLVKQCTCRNLHGRLAEISMTASDKILDFMYVLKVPFQVILALEHPRAQVTLEGLNIANEMHCV